MRPIDADAAVEYLKDHKAKRLSLNCILVADEDSIIKFINEKCPTIELSSLFFDEEKEGKA